MTYCIKQEICFCGVVSVDIIWKAPIHVFLLVPLVILVPKDSANVRPATLRFVVLLDPVQLRDDADMTEFSICCCLLSLPCQLSSMS